MSNTFEVTITLPKSLFLRNVAGKPVNLDWTSVPAAVIADIACGGAKVLLTNAFNSGGKDVKESDRLANMQKRMDAWARGEYAITERAASQTALMAECYIAEMLARHDGTSEKAVRDAMRATVTKMLGKDTKATFVNFLQATATAMAKADGEKRSKDELLALLTAKYEKAAAELEAERAKASTVELDLSIDI